MLENPPDSAPADNAYYVYLAYCIFSISGLFDIRVALYYTIFILRARTGFDRVDAALEAIRKAVPLNSKLNINAENNNVALAA